MSKARKSIPIHTRRVLLVEAGNRCSMPHCKHETGLEIHHIDEDTENASINNLLLLCAVHHAQATRRLIDRKTCELIKIGLSCLDQQVYLGSRRELVEKAIAHLKSSNYSYRNLAVGPFLLSPPWYMERHDDVTSVPNFDRELFEFVTSNSAARNSEIRLMFSLSERYVTKINFLVGVDERHRFVDGVLENVGQVFGANYDRGPDICCYHSGYSNIDMIFDDAVISTYRLRPDVPTSSGVYSHNQNTVSNARMRFDDIFDANSLGQRKEIEKLVLFIKTLWTI